jgi:hypothetical protein
MPLLPRSARCSLPALAAAGLTIRVWRTRYFKKTLEGWEDAD